MSIVSEDKTYRLRRCFFDVQNGVGLGRDEEPYHQAIVHWLDQHQVPYRSKQPHWLALGGRPVHCLIPDLVAWNEIIIELKSVARRLESTEFVQLRNYLKLRGDRLGLLVNMGLGRVDVERVVYDPPETCLREDWTSWKDRIAGREQNVGRRIREALRMIYREHTTGYGKRVMDHLIPEALAQTNLDFLSAPLTKNFFNTTELEASKLDCLIIENTFVLTQTALFDDNRYNIDRARSFMRTLNIPWGIAVNFGKTQAEFIALHHPDR